MFSTITARTKLIKFIRGSKAKDVPENMRTKNYYGLGHDKKEDFWKDLISAMISNGYLREHTVMNDGGYPYGVPRIDVEGRLWIDKNKNNPSPVMELEMTENMFIETKLEKKSVTGMQQYLHQVIKIGVLDFSWLTKFMLGPWKESNQMTNNKHSNVIGLEKDLKKKLIEIREDIAVCLILYYLYQ